MKNISIIIFSVILLNFLNSCSKNDPTIEVDQEEVSGASLTFTEVTAEAHDDHFHYHDIEGAEVEKIDFKGSNLLPAVGAHVHLEVGKSYRFQLTVRDFADRESQQTFIERDDQHFAFILGVPADAITVTYADKKADGTRVKVGTIGYITVKKPTNSFVFNYVLRHLNPGVKSTIDPVKDIFTKDYTKFGGANDLDLKFELHLVNEDEHAH